MTDGDGVIDTEGVVEGNTVGFSDGRDVWNKAVGKNVGIPVGADGIIVGLYVGSTVELDVGSDDGEKVGFWAP